MGACLAQLDEHGIERPVAYASCNLSTAQKNYGKKIPPTLPVDAPAEREEDDDTMGGELPSTPAF
jgi:hypothetical protein